jgi:hypothetical protein
MKKMKLKLSFAALALPAAFFTVASACDDGSVAVPCTVDEDCLDLVDTTTCDPDLLICVPPADRECADDSDCQLINPDAPTTVEDCANDNDCSDDGTETCVQTEGATVCAVLSAGPADCGDDVEVSANKVDGGDAVNVCASPDGTCDDQGSCTF